MSECVLLILVDGMRPDSLDVCEHPFIRKMGESGSYAADSRAVMPSVTLPCHMSLFHSVAPDRHGILTNTYTPQVRPVNGLCEQLRLAGKTNALFYSWGELKDLARPDSLALSVFISGHLYTYKTANETLTREASRYINSTHPDFVFLYLGETDEIGHQYGWMSDEYIQSVYDSWSCIEQIVQDIPEHYTTIITADHGGHDRMHGTDSAEDMTIPLFIRRNQPGSKLDLSGTSIMDIAPTITSILGAQAAPEWEGRSLI